MEQKTHLTPEVMAALSRHEDLAREELESLAITRPSSWDLPLALVQGLALGGAIYIGSSGARIYCARLWFGYRCLSPCELCVYL